MDWRRREPLPSRPSLEMQKKRAKELLRAIWGGDEGAVEVFVELHPKPPAPDDARLADAQLVIARGHGFTSWTALRDKIEALTLTPVQRLVRAVCGYRVEEARALLEEHPELKRRLDDPLGPFDGTLLISARPHLEMVDLLLDYGADINRKSAWWAGGFGILEADLDPKLVSALVERGAEVTVWAAAHQGDIARLGQLLQEDPGLVHARGGDGKTALHCASTVEAVDLLVDAGADLEAEDVDHESTPLHYAIDKPEVARRLLERGARPDLFAAVALGDVELCRTCVYEDSNAVGHRLGVPPWAPRKHRAAAKIYNWTLGHDLTPLDVARKFGHREVAELLLEHAPPKARLVDAIWRGDGTAARAVLEADRAVLKELEDDDRRLMARASWWYRPEAVRLMLELGFDPHVAGVHDSTPLDRAAFHGYADIVALLLEHDPEPPLERLNEFGGTPLGACIHGARHGWRTGFPQDHEATVRLLVGAGAQFDLGDMPTGHDAIDAVLLAAWRERERSGA